jgi:hypothetical protein
MAEGKVLIVYEFMLTTEASYTAQNPLWAKSEMGWDQATMSTCDVRKHWKEFPSGWLTNVFGLAHMGLCIS